MTGNCKSGSGVMLLLFLQAAICGMGSAQVLRGPKKPITVSDAIEMTRWGDPLELHGGPPGGEVARFSPDGKHFVVVLKKGDLTNNTNRYSLLLFRTSTAFDSPKPKTIWTMAASTNRDAISDLRWLADNSTIVFLGEYPGKQPQIYALNIKTHQLRELTAQPSPVVAYDITKDGKKWIYEADPPNRNAFDDTTLIRTGIVLDPSMTIEEILAGNCYRLEPSLFAGDQLFVQASGRRAVRVPLNDVIFRQFSQPLFSPNGRYAIFQVFIRNIPQAWTEYEDRFLHKFIQEKRSNREASNVRQYMLLDTNTMRVGPLIEAPLSFNSAAVWAPNGASLIVSGTYLPLDVEDPNERQARKKNAYAVEVRLPSCEWTEISHENLKVLAWNDKDNRVVFQSKGERGGPPITFQKAKGKWLKGQSSPDEVKGFGRAPLDVVLREDMNTPPKIYVLDPKTRREALLLDLNPQFSGLQFGRVEAVHWKATDGHEVIGGLFFPPGYVPGKRYPLVLQTHGFRSDRFWMDGPWDSAFAARPMAAKGIMVLQVGGSRDPAEELRFTDTPKEAPMEMAAYLGAIKYLEGRGFIDPSHVGIIGFSRTVYEVAYTLTHSKFPFAAATLADGFNGGYFQYMRWVNPSSDYSLVNGGPPFGKNLAQWIENSPSFNLENVHTPVRLESYGRSGGLLSEWDWYVGLSDLRKPVELVYLPNAPHLLVKPWERMASEQGNVDWFCFWLKGEEDPDPAKEEQYKRWNRLRSSYALGKRNLTAQKLGQPLQTSRSPS